MESGNGHHLEHPALLYESREDFLEYMVPYVTAGLENREVVFVAARADNIAALGNELGKRAGGARLADTGEWHPHTGNRLRAFYELVTDELEAGTTGIRLAGEPVWPDGPAELIREWQRYESVLNWVLGPFPVTLVCLYDASRLDPSILEVSHVTHPVVGRDGREQPSGEFADPEEFLRRWNHDLAPPPAWAVRTTELGDLSAARWLLGDLALAAGVHPDRVSDLVSAANEALTNAEVHENGAIALWAWSEEGRFVCQIEDRGHGIADPLAGYRPPSRHEDGTGPVDRSTAGGPAPGGCQLRRDHRAAPRASRLTRTTLWEEASSSGGFGESGAGYFPAFFPFLAFRFSFRLFCASFLLVLLPPLSLFAKVLLLSAIARSSG